MSRSFQIETSEQRERLFAFLKARELPFQVEYGPVREQRSLNQNRRLYSLHSMAAKVTGHTVEELHELMLARHFGTKEIEIGGFRKIVPLKRSSARDKKEFAAFMESVESFYAAELGLWLGSEDER